MFKKGNSSKRQNMNGWFCPEVLQQNLSLFFLTQENAFSWNFHLKSNRKSIGSCKNSIRDFQNSPPFERSACLYVTVTGNFENFRYFNFETDFLKKWKTFSKKLEYHYLVESTKTESVTFLYKTTVVI